MLKSHMQTALVEAQMRTKINAFDFFNDFSQWSEQGQTGIFINLSMVSWSYLSLLQFISISELLEKYKIHASTHRNLLHRVQGHNLYPLFKVTECSIGYHYQRGQTYLQLVYSYVMSFFLFLTQHTCSQRCIQLLHCVHYLFILFAEVSNKMSDKWICKPMAHIVDTVFIEVPMTTGEL